ncbi:MAG: DNA topoisomerase IB [Chloroflexi bacterium]|nr:DNA topoisomerase IB [Chloroflexota bacterium]
MSEQTIDVDLYHDPQGTALVADVLYVSDDQPGFQRKRRGRGFIYCDENGDLIRDPALLERFKTLVIPPGWTNVWICAESNGHIQVTGRDEQGRKQYIYHTRWAEVRNLAKFNRLLPFAERLPAIRAQVSMDLKAPCLSQAKVVAIVVRLLEETHIRIGNPEYVRQNQSYGLTTLRKRHMQLAEGTIRLKFKAKSGKLCEMAIEDKKLVRLIKKCQELPGQTIFQYIDDGGSRHTVQSTDVNDYLHTITGEHFTAKDFRTWGGTVAAASALYQFGPAQTVKECKANLVKSIKEAAHMLNNTPTVCRQYYVHPAIPAAYSDNSLFTAMQQAAEQVDDAPFALDIEEKAVVQILRQYDAKTGSG